jgi:hypothetical protein
MYQRFFEKKGGAVIEKQSYFSQMYVSSTLNI